jgi:hypothetical protein
MVWRDGCSGDASAEVRADVRRIEICLETLVDVLTDAHPPTFEADTGLAQVRRMSAGDIIDGMITYRRDVMTGARPLRPAPAEDAERRARITAAVDAIMGGGA